ncbi:MAG TPA: hypothetical protein PK876_02320 [Elusimicrobiota bacterium]|nr:hypothetical protein [Elusimicrobiota bacterium]
MVTKAGLGDFLRTVRPGFPPELMTAKNFARLEKLMDALPPAYGVVYEFWLKGTEPEVDLQCYFRPGEGLTLADDVPVDSPVWRSVKTLMGLWRERGESLYDGFWLEFDLSSGGGEAVPRVGFAMNDMIGGTGGEAKAVFARYLESFRHTAGCLPGGDVPVGTEDLLKRCYEVFPDHTHLYGTGYSYMKDGLAVRWCITFEDWTKIPDYLRRIGWQGDVARLEADMPRWPDVKQVALALDFYGGISPRVGLEYYLTSSAMDAPGAWRGPLEDASRRGLVDARWPTLLAGIGDGYSRRKSPASWPPVLSAMTDFTGQEGYIGLYFAHIKMNFEAGRFTNAKNYVYSTYGYFESQSQ